MHIRPIAILLATGSLAVAGYAAAQPYETYGPNDDVVVTGAAPSGDREVRSEVVSYADLNLNTADGRAVLMARIQRAAEQVCGPEPDSRDLKPLMAFRRCMSQAVNTAVAAIPSASQLAGSAKPAG